MWGKVGEVAASGILKLRDTMRKVIGCGAELRGDDAAGLLVARGLRRMGIDAVAHTGDGAALIECWSGCERVVLVDAVVSGAAHGAILAWDGLRAPVERSAFRSAHAFGVAEGIELARALGRLPASLALYGIESREFGPGSEPSAPVMLAVETLIARIAKELSR